MLRLIYFILRSLKIKLIKSNLTQFFLLISLFPFLSFGQTINGKIYNYPSQIIQIQVLFGKNSITVDSIFTDKNSSFTIDLNSIEDNIQNALLEHTTSISTEKIIQFSLPRNQFFYLILNSKKPENIFFETVYNPSIWDNWALDSLTIRTSNDNIELYKFLKLHKKLRVANKWLLELMRLYPYSDPFHSKIVQEYDERFKQLNDLSEDFINSKSNNNQTFSASSRIILAYFNPIIQDYKIPDGENFAKMREHFFDYYDPNDSLFLFSSILIDKLDEWINIHHHHKKDMAGLFLEEKDILDAINSYIEKIDRNIDSRQQILNYALRLMYKENNERMFLEIYDKWLKPNDELCGDYSPYFKWAHEQAQSMRNVVIGSTAPDFKMEIAGTNQSIYFRDLPGEYKLLLFWSTWCNHCIDEIPRIKKEISMFQEQGIDISVIAISLDVDSKAWTEFVKANNLYSWLHYCDLEGWQGKIVKLYNIYATPSLVLIDNNNKIISKPYIIEHIKKDIGLN